MKNELNFDYAGEFLKFAKMDLNLSSKVLSSISNLDNSVTQIGMTDELIETQNSVTPYILEERQMRVTQMDIFSRMMMDRILWISGVVEDQMSMIIQAQLMFLDNLDSTRDITMHIDTPGGSVKSGLGMVDVMDFVRPDIATVNVGMCASMGSILLGAGAKGKRSSLRHSKVMMHQVSAGAQGNWQDMKISMDETEKYNKILFGLLSEYTGKTTKKLLKDTERDLWLDAEESKEYGILDNIVTKRADK